MDSLIVSQHISTICTNLPYLVAGTFACVFLYGKWKLISIPIFLTFASSIVNHLNIGDFEVKRWASIIDRTTGTFTGIAGIALLLYFWKDLDVCPAVATLITAILAIFIFVVAELRASLVIKTLDANNTLPSRLRALDPVQGLTHINATNESLLPRQAEYLCEHSLWHLASGLCMIIFVIAFNGKHAAP